MPLMFPVVNWYVLASADDRTWLFFAITGMNGPVVAGHSAAVQQGLFNQLNDRQADRRLANHRHSAPAAVMMPIQPDQRHHVMQAERESKSMSTSAVRSPGCVCLLLHVSHLHMSPIFGYSLAVLLCLLFKHFCCLFVTVGSLRMCGLLPC